MNTDEELKLMAIKVVIGYGGYEKLLLKEDDYSKRIKAVYATLKKFNKMLK